MAELDWAQLLRDRPDVRAEYQQESTRDRKSQTNLFNQGVLDEEDFAEWWYNNYGRNEGYTQAAPVTQAPPAVEPPPVYTPPPPVIDRESPFPYQDYVNNAFVTAKNAAVTPAGPVGTGEGTTTTPGGNRDIALQQALYRARMNLFSQGLNPDQYMEDIGKLLADVHNIIPETETNAGSYFDPNFADMYIGGLSAQARSGARNYVQSALRKPNLDYTALDATISKLLSEGIKEGEDYLTRGQQRGQFNEAGITAGRTKLNDAKSKATAKLRGYADSVYGKYSTQFDDIYNRALADASDTDISSGFDLSPYASEFDRLSGRVSGAGLEGELLGLAGSEPLIDLSDLRSGIAKGQGTTNLRDMDVLEGLDQRKRASNRGRGLGSEGVF
jgi:hypothetical protein